MLPHRQRFGYPVSSKRPKKVAKGASCFRNTRAGQGRSAQAASTKRCQRHRVATGHVSRVRILDLGLLKRSASRRFFAMSDHGSTDMRTY